MVSVTAADTRGSGVTFDTPPAIDHTGARVAFVTQNTLVTGDTDGSFDAYVRNQVGGGGENTQLVSVGAGGDAMRMPSRCRANSTRLAYTNGRVWVATCVFTCGGPIQADGARARQRRRGTVLPATGRERRAAEPDGALLAHARGAGPGRHRRRRRPLLAPTSPPAPHIFLKAHRRRRRERRRRGRLDARLRHAADDQPPGVGRHDEAGLARQLGGFANLSQPLGAPPRLNGAGTPASDAGT